MTTEPVSTMTDSQVTYPAMDHLLTLNITTLTCAFKLCFSDTTLQITLPIEVLTFDYNTFKNHIQDRIVNMFNITEFDVISTHNYHRFTSGSPELKELDEVMQCFPLITLPKFVENPKFITACDFPFYIRDSNYKNMYDIIPCSVCYGNNIACATTCGYVCSHTLCINCYNSQLNHGADTHRCPECRSEPRLQASHMAQRGQNNRTSVSQLTLRASNARARARLQTWREEEAQSQEAQP